MGKIPTPREYVVCYSLGDAGWKSVQCARDQSVTLATIERGTGSSNKKAFIFALRYDDEDRIGLYAYKGESNEIVAILAAARVDIITGTPSYGNNYELYIDGNAIKITNVASNTMTFSTKII